MTRKLYWENPYQKEFQACIEKVRPSKTSGTVELLLDQTAFYPEGGGQPSDLGTLDGNPVSYVYQEETSIWHVVTSSAQGFSAGDEVAGVLDWPRRFDHMQQHLGQHILSAVFDHEYEARTIGFHLGKHHVTIDLNKGPFTQNELEEVELTVNDIVFENLEVMSTLVSDEVYHAMDLRKSPDIANEIRLVKIPDKDVCACSGTHPKSTGEVGLIKILKSEAYKGGCRLTFLCGRRALAAFHQMQVQAQQAAASLSLGWPELSEGVQGLLQENKQLAKDNKDIRQQWSLLKRDRLIAEAPTHNGVSVVMMCDNTLEYKTLTFLANSFRETAQCIALLGITNPSPRFVLLNNTNLPELNMNALLKESIHHIDGKGGGNAASAQGGGTRSEGLAPMLSEIREAIIDTLKQSQ